MNCYKNIFAIYTSGFTFVETCVLCLQARRLLRIANSAERTDI